MARSVRTKQYLYTEHYIGYSTRRNLVFHVGAVYDRGLYDHTTEVLETYYNVAGNSSHRAVLEELSKLILTGGRLQFHPGMAHGSAHH